MSLDIELNKHLDNMEELEDKFKKEIDSIIQAIDRKKLVDNPREVLKEVSLAIGDLIEQKYMNLSAAEGLALGKIIERFKKQGKDIIVDASKNPKENEGIVYDKGRGQD